MPFCRRLRIRFSRPWKPSSAGLSLLTKDGKGFIWAAIAGAWRPYLGGGTPRDFGPCGDVLDSNATTLFTHWERRYPYLSAAKPLAEEGLLVPFHLNGTLVGTIWAIAHGTDRKFDAEDQRLLENIGRFAAAAYQTADALDELRSEIVTRNKAEAELRALTDRLEDEVRVRTRELEHRNEELRRSEAFLTEGQRLSSTGSFSWRLENDDIRFSAELYRLFAFEQDLALTPDRIAARVHPDDMPLLTEGIERAGRDSHGLACEIRLRMPDGSIKYCSVLARGYGDMDGSLEYFGAIQDITSQHLSDLALSKLRSDLAHTARVTSLGTLTASIAHEINQPLSGILANAGTGLRMLAADPPNVAGAQETTRRTLRDAKRASDVISRLRALFAKRETATELVDLNEASREVIALSQKGLRDAGSVLQLDLADRAPLVKGDRIQLQQVILNLILNAAEAMAEVDDRPRQLIIRTARAEPDDVLFAVQDAGPGIAPANAERIFDAFYTTKADGLGIGLSVCQTIIEAHGGKLWASDAAPRGAIVQFRLPLSEAAQEGRPGQ